MSKSTSLKKVKSLRRSGTIKTKDSLEEKVEKINLDDFDFFQKLSKVNNGVLRLCQKIENGHYFCMRVLKKVELLESKILEHLYNEFQKIIKNISSFYNPIKRHKHKRSKRFIFFIWICTRWRTFKYLRKKFKISWRAGKVLCCITCNCNRLSSQKNIIYRNISPENIMLTSNGYIKIVNFNNAKILKGDYTNTLCGTPEYSSPEMLNRKGHGKSHDLWGLGIILYHMLIGHTPFEDTDPLKMQQKILKGKPVFPKSSTISKDAKYLIKHLLIVDPKKRLGNGKNGIYDIISNPFFKWFDRQNLLFQNLVPPYVPLIKGNNDISNFKKYEDNYFENPEVEVDKEKDPFYKWD